MVLLQPNFDVPREILRNCAESNTTLPVSKITCLHHGLLRVDHDDGMLLRGAVDESGKFVTMDNASNDRKTIGMHGSGFIEMLARQMTADLQAERDSTGREAACT